MSEMIRDYETLSNKMKEIQEQFDAGNQKKGIKLFNKLYNEISSRSDTINITLELTGTKKVTMKDDFKEIVAEAKKLGILYIGVTKSNLVKQVNEKIVENLLNNTSSEDAI